MPTLPVFALYILAPLVVHWFPAAKGTPFCHNVPVKLISPLTSSLYAGLAVPIPILPLDTLIALVPKGWFMAGLVHAKPLRATNAMAMLNTRIAKSCKPSFVLAVIGFILAYRFGAVPVQGTLDPRLRGDDNTGRGVSSPPFDKLMINSGGDPLLLQWRRLDIQTLDSRFHGNDI